MDLHSLVARIQNGDPNASIEFYQQFARIVRRMIATRLRGHPEFEDALQDVMIAVLRGVQQGRLSAPEALPKYISGIVRNIAFRYLRKTIQARSVEVDHKDPSLHLEAPYVDVLAETQRERTTARIRNILAAMPPLDREVLTRFYLLGETPSVIQEAMGLTNTQFRLRKSRAKGRLVAAFRRNVAVKERPEEPPLTDRVRSGNSI